MRFNPRIVKIKNGKSGAVLHAWSLSASVFFSVGVGMFSESFFPWQRHSGFPT